MLINPEEETDLKKKKIMRYSLIIGIILLIIFVVIIIVVVTKKKSNNNNSNTETDSYWSNLIPQPSEGELKELKNKAYEITTSMSQEEIQEILSDSSYQIILFKKGIYNLKIESENKINGLSFSRKRYVILEKDVIFNVIGEPFKKFTDYYAIIFVRVEATEEEPMIFIGTLEINGNRNPAIDANYKGQSGMGLAMYSSKNIYFQEIISYDNHGDGIYISSGIGYGEGGEIQCYSCSNIRIGKATCKRNYRNGMSVIAGLNIIMNELYLEESIGSLPEAGIDFEPNHICEKIDININKIFTKRNNKCGLTTGPSNSESIKVNINEVHSDHDSLSLKTGNFGFYAEEKQCDKVLYFYHIKNVYFNVVEGRDKDKDKYIVSQNWGTDCHKLEIDNINFVD